MGWERRGEIGWHFESEEEGVIGIMFLIASASRADIPLSKAKFES